MKLIHFAGNVPVPSEGSVEKKKTVTHLLDDGQCRVVSVELCGGERLTKHHAAEPISVLCLSGRGSFTAGPDLAERIDLEEGTLITLPAGIEHEVIAEPDLRILVTKYKQGKTAKS